MGSPPLPRVLITDDECHIQRAASLKLTRGGFRVDTASDGQEAWELIQQAPPDLLITDYQMPRMSGIDLCRCVRNHPPTRHLPVILLTAKGFELNQDALQLELVLSHILMKPFSPRDLLRLARQTLQLPVTDDIHTERVGDG